MKSLNELAWHIGDKEYHESPILSFSTISRYYKEGFENLDKLYDKIESPSLLFGSVVDTLLLGTKEEFDNNYFVCTVPLISDEFKELMNAIKDELGTTHKSLMDIPDKVIVEYLDRFGIYQNNWHADTKANKVREACSTYYNMLHLSDGKTIVNTEVYNDAVACVEALKTSVGTEFYFRNDNKFDGIERVKQLKIKGDYQGIGLRGMLDLCVVDHNNKTIQPCDLKTSSNEEYNFPRSFIKYCYYMQASIYTYLLKQIILKDDYFKDFKILPFKFIVVCNRTRKPKVWEFNLSLAETEITIETSHQNMIYLASWRSIVPELNKYLTVKPDSPDGIYDDKPNDIVAAIKGWR